MSFLEQNKISRKNKTELSLGGSPGNEIIYFFTVVIYFVRKNIGKVLLFFLAFYLICLRFAKREGEPTTEMIGGMEVPRLKDNYDLSLD